MQAPVKEKELEISRMARPTLSRGEHLQTALAGATSSPPMLPKASVSPPTEPLKTLKLLGSQGIWKPI